MILLQNRNKPQLHYILLVAFFFFITNEVLSRNGLGIYYSLFFSSIIFAIICIRSYLGVVVFTLVTILYDEFPRDVLLSYTDYTFNTIKTLTIGPYSIYILLALTLLSKMFIYKHHWKLLAVLMLLSLVALAGTISGILTGFFSPVIFLANSKFIILIFLGALSSSYIMKLIKAPDALDFVFALVFFCGLVAALRAYFNLALDISNGSYYVFDIGTEPLFLIAGSLYFTSYQSIYLIGYLTTSRGEILLLALTLLTILLMHTKRIFRFSNIFLPSILIIFLYYIVATYIPFLLDFFYWKLSEIEVFGGPSSGSSLIRQYELYNVVCTIASNPISLLFGNGLGATFDFSCYPLPPEVTLDEKSFSLDQIQNNKFYGVHNTITALLLRFGLLGFLLFMSILLFACIYTVKSSITRSKKIATVLLLFFCFYYLHSQPSAQFLFGFICFNAFRLSKFISMPLGETYGRGILN